jgi:hypothetical protein
MIKRTLDRFFLCCTDEINIKKIFPWFALQRTRFNFGEADVAQRKHAHGFEQGAGLILQGEDDGSFRITLRDYCLAANGKEACVIFRVIFTLPAVS